MLVDGSSNLTVRNRRHLRKVEVSKPEFELEDDEEGEEE